MAWGPTWCWLKLLFSMNTFCGWLVELKINLLASVSHSASPYPQDVPSATRMGGREQVCCKGLCVSSGGEISGIHWLCLPRRTWLVATSGCGQSRGRSPGACTTHAEDKHHVLIARVFTLLPDVLLELFDYTNNKWASRNVFLKASEAQGWEVTCTPKLAEEWCVAGPLN